MFTIFFDIASAFDKVWHNGLVYKLIDSKFPNHLISWIKEFLKNRLFCVRVESVITSKLNILAGVPQGAQLYSLFLSMVKFSKKKFYSLVFVYNFCAFKIFKKFGNIKKQIQAYLNLFEKWRLMMAPLKCNYTIFSS
jgi:hypothetical protein